MRRLLALFAVVIVLALGLWWVMQQEREVVQGERAAARVFTLDNRQIRELSLVRGEERWDFRYNDEDARWRMAAPRRDLASGEQLSNLIFLLGQPIVERTIESPEALTAYGLDPPVISVILEEGDELQVDVGAATPTGDGLFARVRGREGVLVLTDFARQSFLGRPDPNLLREPALFDLLKSEIVEIEFRGAEGFTLGRADDGWWLTRPQRLPAADSQINTLLEVLEETEVRAFLDDDDRADGGEALLDLRLASQTHERQLRFSRGAGGTVTAVVEGRETVLQVEATRIESIPNAAGSFISRRLTKVNRYGVTGFSFSGTGEVWAARREDERWSLADGTAVEERRVLGFLAAALGARADGWRGGGAAGAGIARLDYTLEDGSTGSLTYLDGNEAVWSEVPDVRFIVPGGVPTVPAD